MSGSLGLAHGGVVATHLLSCSTCGATVSFLRRIGTVFAAGVPAVAPPSGVLERCLADVEKDAGRSDRADGRVTVGGTELPPSLRDFRPGRLRWLAPGIRHSTLWRDGRSTLHFIRVEAGVSLPAHRHRGLELTCVLSGAYRDDGRLFRAGDVSEEDDEDESGWRGDADHLVVAEPTGACVCIMATTGRLRFSGWMARWLQPVMPF